MVKQIIRLFHSKSHPPCVAIKKCEIHNDFKGVCDTGDIELMSCASTRLDRPLMKTYKHRYEIQDVQLIYSNVR